jgi:hypothetical protein
MQMWPLSPISVMTDIKISETASCPKMFIQESVPSFCVHDCVNVDVNDPVRVHTLVRVRLSLSKEGHGQGNGRGH